MNRLELFLQYAQKVFELNGLLRRVRDGRSNPTIPILPVILCLLLGVVLRISSYYDLSAQTQRRRWRHLCRLKKPIGDDLFGYVTERMQPEDWRQIQARMVKRLKHNKALESCKIKGLLFVSLDANEHFKSRSRCCDSCCQRQIEIDEGEGKTKKVTEYYHRYVVAQINGPKINIVMDVEPIRPGEDECGAALRLLGRLRRIYGSRFFDAITADAWYARGSFLKAVQTMGWQWVVVLKRQDMNVYQEARQLSQGQNPCASFEDVRRDRQVQLWDVKDLDFSQEYAQKVRAVRSEERWIEKRIWGGIKTQKPQCSQWFWAASDGLGAYAPELVYDAGHRRWGIENKAFNELTQGHHLEHCYHHDPTAMLVQMLILVFGFTLFTAFALHCQWVRTGRQTLKSLAHDLDLALEEDRLWDQWFHCG